MAFTMDRLAAESQDYAALRTLLEPFLLDALTLSLKARIEGRVCSHQVVALRKQNGRETPHNSTSDTKVEILCFIAAFIRCLSFVKNSSDY